MSEQDIRIAYSLVGTGWSRCVVETAGGRAELSASYLSDALGNLVLAALAISSGFRSVEFGFDEEPGEYRWCISGLENDIIQVRVAEFPQLWGQLPIEAGRIHIDAQTTPRAFVQAVHACATGVLEEYGAQGYAEKWSAHPFPERTLHLLGEAMAEWHKDEVK